MSNLLGADVGRFFEVGFNVGALTYLHQKKDLINTQCIENTYLEDLQQLQFPKMAKKAIINGKIIGETKRNLAEQWLLFFLERGFLTGYNFIEEYLQSLSWERQSPTLDLLYYQCSFCNDNSMHTIYKDQDDEYALCLKQLEQWEIATTKADITKHNGKSEFLHADTLLLFRFGSQMRILCIDLSIFSIARPTDLVNFHDIENLRLLMMSEVSYLRSKGVFSSLNIDAGSTLSSLHFSEGLANYLTAFKKADKESAKLIQAGGYAYDFYEFLQNKQFLQSDCTVVFNIFGFTNRGVNSIAIDQSSLPLLKVCQDIYRNESANAGIEEARKRVLEMIATNAERSFENSADFIQCLQRVDAIPDGTHWFSPHKETITQFLSSEAELPIDPLSNLTKEKLSLGEEQSITVKNAHARLVFKALNGPVPYLFLTGNPGIGKTWAITEYLKDHLTEGFLLLYVSPRKQVNLDVIKNFHTNQPDEKHLREQVLAITSNAPIIEENEGKPTVEYYSDSLSGDLEKQGVKAHIDFLDRKITKRTKRDQKTSRIERFQEDFLKDKGTHNSGVLQSVCHALYANIQESLSNAVVATASIQSLKQIGGDQTTIVHLEKIFHGAWNQKKMKVIPEKMKEISSRIKHIFIMIDEVTGDEGGVEFLEGVRQFVRRFELDNPNFGFNTKIIIADASIVDIAVIQHHLERTDFEPDKIYFRKADIQSIAPLTWEDTTFGRKPAIAINANSYPASNLHITYNVGIQSFLYDGSFFDDKRKILRQSVQEKMLEDILTLLRSSEKRQCIVYIQDKRRLTELIKKIRDEGEPFVKNEQYLEIHANISEKARNEIRDFKDKVRVIFMTASASRGLSFPSVRSLLVDVPHFEIEQNLMEIIQVIYRGRGKRDIDLEEKDLILYLSDKAVYYTPEDRELSLRERMLHILNVLLILKTSIMTRITGAGVIGQDQFMLIPIGGKSVLAAGNTFIEAMNNLFHELSSAYRERPGDVWLETVRTRLKILLGRAKTRLIGSGSISRQQELRNIPMTYLNFRSTFTNQFEECIYQGFDRLLDWKPMEFAYISGGLLIVPFKDRTMQGHYLMNIAKALVEEVQSKELWGLLKKIQEEEDYPESLRRAVKGALDLIEAIQRSPSHRTLHFLQDSSNEDQYYAIPLLAFLGRDIFQEYYSKDVEEPNEASFRQILGAYISTLYPSNEILPIGDEYQEFPFVVFRSAMLQDIRKHLFSTSSIFNSHELNILNLTLSYENDR